ncbi:glycosyltransferase family 9 protein [Endomicrobium proavitum]|uniref:ADP-heptose:LPS heptosyltransferase II n=1 Tax=Endomicrobium proavitum TaxID=1408281 RepID=A0A0G3WII2_9BACT|nr:glycosyltransferase family 9 protein [Endomicrobium proavitum]AKL97700.1 ADP-heptose:LPS heptosyltransferase II [Endomicrobium proavitum]
MRKILISCSSLHIGDFIWATSAIAALKQTYPEYYIAVLAPKALKELIKNNPVIDEAVFSLYPKAGLFYKIKNLLWTARNIPKIYFKKFDDCIILSHSKLTVMLAKICRIPNLAGADMFWTGNNIADPLAKFYTHAVHVQKNQDNVHMSVRFQTIVKSYFNFYNNALPVVPNIKKYDYAQNFIKNKDKINIAFCIAGSKDSSNVWSLENFATVIKELSKTFNADFYITGSNKDSKLAQQLISGQYPIPPTVVYNLCGKTSLLELTNFLSRVNLLITVDTGIAHLAATQNANILALYGPTPPQKSMPMSHNARTIYIKTECSPCMYRKLIENNPCPKKEAECMLKITPQTVIEQASEILKALK